MMVSVTGSQTIRITGNHSSNRLFRRLCGTVDNHSDLFKILPDGNEYMPICAGSLSVVVKASVNHERVAEGLADSLCRINSAVADVQIESDLFGTGAMLRLVAELYEHVFLFLGRVFRAE